MDSEVKTEIIDKRTQINDMDSKPIDNNKIIVLTKTTSKLSTTNTFILCDCDPWLNYL
jgi:hypothetical protein